MLNGFPDNFRRNDEDVLNEFRQKQVNFDLEERRNEINNSRSLFIGALAGLAMAGVVGWFVLAPQYAGDTEEDIPVIRRQQTEVKMPPAEPGGIEFSNRENTVYEIIERKNEEPEEEIVLPPAETPNIDAIETLIQETEPVENATASEPQKAEIKVESLAAGSKPAAAAKNEASAPKMTEAAPKTEPAATVAAVKEVKKEPVAPAPVTAAKGSWQIQLMSSPNKAAVEKSWKNLTKKFSLLAGQNYEISAADLGKKGTYYRLRAGTFASKEQANEFCTKLKAAGGSCFTARK